MKASSMRNHTILLLLLPVSLCAQVLRDSLSAVVVDRETGEPVPYASVYVSPSCGTICNYDGEFCLECLPSEVLRITSIGYQRFTCKASELPDTVRMKPVSSVLRELTVMASDNLLDRLVRSMLKEAKKHKRAEGHYFFRLTTQYPGTDELAEAFLTAKSCVQLRDIVFHSGNRGLLSEKGLEDPDLKGLGRTNLHAFLRLAPVMPYYNDWDFALTPGDILLNRRGKLYDVSCTSFKEDDGTEIVCIHLSGRSASTVSAILDGTLYVDRAKCELRRFEGEMRGLRLKTYDNARRRVTIDSLRYTMHVDYRHDHGFTETASMSGTIVSGEVMLRYLLFNLGDKEMTFTRSVRVGKNMLQTIDEVGYDSTLWAATGIVKRTRREERVAFGDAAFFVSRKAETPTPSAQEQEANKFLSDALRRLKEGSMQLHRGLPGGR